MSSTDKVLFSMAALAVFWMGFFALKIGIDSKIMKAKCESKGGVFLPRDEVCVKAIDIGFK